MFFLNRRFILLSVTLFATFSLMACLSDIRPVNLAELEAARNSQKALSILKEAANQTHRSGQGFERWHAQAGVALDMQDEWFGFLGWMILPYELNPQPAHFQFMPGKDNSKLTFKTNAGKNSDVAWGIHEWNVWHKEAGKAPVYEQAHDIHFMLPTLQYFAEMVYRLPQGQAIRDYAGEQKIGGQTYHVVYMTWGAYPPNDRNDQYLAYINKESMRLERVDYTVRDKADFVSDSVVYGDFKQVGDFVLPHKITIGSKNIDEAGLHTVTVNKYHLNQNLKMADIAPEPNRPAKSKY